MIFVTVGTDLPFDRMVRVVDEWALESGRLDVFAQIGEGGWEPKHMRFANFLAPPEFAEHFAKARVIISHAGMGTILTALCHEKPILVMPKKASLGEHRNEHQTATARRMMELAGVNAAFDESELRAKLDRLDELTGGHLVGGFASDSLVSAIRGCIFSDSSRARPVSAMKLSQWIRAITSVCDPRSYFHLFRLVHYYGYSHVRPRRMLQAGDGTGIAPNVSLRNGERIRMGRGCHIGEGCFLWAGDTTGRIEMGDHVSLAPGVFITASDYRFVAGQPFREQPKSELDVRLGNDVWLGAGVVVTAGVTVGDGCIVGAGAVVTKDLPSGSIAVGVPARVVGQRPETLETATP